MSHNQVLQLNANFLTWERGRAAGLKGVQPFLYYALEHILKPFNLAEEDIRYGITDHPNDGGIDAIYILANRNTPVRDDLDVATSGTDRLRILIFQVKSSDSETGFKPSDVDKFTFFTADLLDLGKEAQTFTHKYQGHLITIIKTYKDKYLQIAGNLPKVQVDYYYVTKGDETEITKTAQDSIDRLLATVKQHMPDAPPAQFYPVNTQTLLSFVGKRRQRIRELKWAESQPLPIDDSYVGVVKLEDYYAFLKAQDSNELDELIFESNVRGYQGNSSVNRQLRQTLKDSGTVNFWLLNNGVTVISSHPLRPIDSTRMNIEDPQVVNGLQTSREIFKYFQTRSASLPADKRLVLMRVLRVSDESVRNDIIRATNSQNSMKASALRGTDHIHRQIEELFKQYGFYYDRRPGFYRDQGIAIQKIVGFTELVQATICLLLQRPDDARARPGDYLKGGTRGNAKYASILGMDQSGNAVQPLGFYLKAITIIRKVDEFLESKDAEPGDQRNIKFYVAFYLCCEMTRSLSPDADLILKIDSSQIDASLDRCYEAVWRVYQKLSVINDSPDTVAKGTELLKELKADLAQRYKDEVRAPSKVKPRKIRDVLREGEVT